MIDVDDDGGPPLIDSELAGFEAGLIGTCSPADEAKLYRVTVSKWVDLSCKDLQSKRFWAILHIAHVSRGPVSHCMHFIMDAKPRTQPKLLELLFYKADEIMKEFSALFADDASDDKSCWKPLFDIVTPCAHGASDKAANYVEQAVTVTLETAAGVWSRIVYFLDSFPYKLFWMIREPATRKCEVRSTTATLVLATPDMEQQDRSGFTSKFRHIFRQALQHAADTGLLQDDLYEFLSDLSSMWELDTQEVEGMNGLIKLMLGLAPNIRLPLLSARVTIKKTLAAALPHKDHREAAIHAAIQMHTEACAVPEPWRQLEWKQ